MNFIRNIIAEKRGAKSQDLGLPASALGDRFDEAARTAQINSAYVAARQPFHHPEDEAPEENIFAGDMGEADEAAAPAEAEFEEDLMNDATKQFSLNCPSIMRQPKMRPRWNLSALWPPCRWMPVSCAHASRRPRWSKPGLVGFVADLRAAFAPKLDEVSEERRLRLAMLADDPAEVAQDLPEFFGSAAVSLQPCGSADQPTRSERHALCQRPTAGPA